MWLPIVKSVGQKIYISSALHNNSFTVRDFYLPKISIGAVRKFEICHISTLSVRAFTISDARATLLVKVVYCVETESAEKLDRASGTTLCKAWFPLYSYILTLHEDKLWVGLTIFSVRSKDYSVNVVMILGNALSLP